MQELLKILVHELEWTLIHSIHIFAAFPIAYYNLLISKLKMSKYPRVAWIIERETYTEINADTLMEKGHLLIQFTKAVEMLIRFSGKLNPFL